MAEHAYGTTISAQGSWTVNIPRGGEHVVDIKAGTWNSATVTITSPTGQAYTDHDGVTADQMKGLLMSNGTNTITVGTADPTGLYVNISRVNA